MTEQYAYLGLVSIITLVIGLAFIVVKWPLDRHHTFSQHVARQRVSIYYYVALFSVVFPPLLVFFYRWFAPTFNLPNLFLVLVTISCVLQLACALVPETGGWKSNLHRLLAGSSAVMLPPSLGVLLLSVPDGHNLIIAIASAVMLAVIAYVILNKGHPRNFLVLQTVYFLSFFSTIVYMIFLGF